MSGTPRPSVSDGDGPKLPRGAMLAAALIVGIATAEEWIGCGLNDLVNALLAYPRACG